MPRDNVSPLPIAPADTAPIIDRGPMPPAQKIMAGTIALGWGAYIVLWVSSQLF